MVGGEGELSLPCTVGKASRVADQRSPLTALEREDKMPVAEELWVVQTTTGVELKPKGNDAAGSQGDDAAGSLFVSHG